MQALLLLAAICTVAHSLPNTIDLVNHVDIGHIWLEIGYTNLNIHTWTTVTTTVVNFNADNTRPMLAYFSLPEYGDGNTSHSYPLVPKMNGSPTRNFDGSYSFEGILVMPDDAECSKEYWIPIDPGSKQMPWMIAEAGVYNLSNNMIIVQQGNITRANTNLIRNDGLHSYHHTVTFNYTAGCNEDDPLEPCTYKEADPAAYLPPGAIYKPWVNVASIQQLQTSRRKANSTHLHGGVKDTGGDLPQPKELYLSVRGRRVFTDRAKFMVMTHAVNTDVFPRYEDIHIPELLAFMIYERSVRIKCTEGLVIETETYYSVTSHAVTFNYKSVFDFAPGLFAMLGSMTSVGDSTVLRSFNRTTEFVNFITQEDQCVDREQDHISNESAFAFVVGQVSGSFDGFQEMNCYAVFKNSQPSGVPSGQPSSQPLSDPTCEPSSDPTSSPTTRPTSRPTSRPTTVPTFSPTAYPTLIPTALPTDIAGNCTFTFLLVDLFGDGWYTTYVNLTTTNHVDENSTSYYYQPNCTYKVVSVFSETCSIDVSMLTIDGGKPLLPWESFWILNFEGETYIGDFYSKLTVIHRHVEYSSKLVDYSVPGKGMNKCHECPHPPPYNANSPPGVCDGTATAKECPPGIKDGYPIPPPAPAPKAGPREKGPDGPGAGPGGKGGNDDGAGKGGNDDHSGSGNDDHTGAGKTAPKRALRPDDDHANHTLPKSDDDHTNHTHIKSDDDKSGGNSTDDDHVIHDKDDDFFNSTDDGSGAGSDDHIHYSFGKPKPKTKPPYLVYINMYDELSNGYLDKSGDWSDYYNTAEDEDLDAPLLVPNILVYPKYYIMTKDRQKLVKPPKSICKQKRGSEFCQEALPWNGHFIFRFAGQEPMDPADAATWEFCGLSGGINEEFEFIMREGVCYPLTNKLTAQAYCEYGFETAISMNGAFTITGSFGSTSVLSEVDTSLLEKELALLMPGELSVTIDAITHDVDNAFNVYFKASIIAESMGYDGSQTDKVDTMMYELESTLSEAFESGLLQASLMRDLDAIPNTQADVLRQSSSIKMLGFLELDHLTYQDKRSGVTSHSGESGSSWSVPEQIAIISSPSDKKELSETTGIISLFGVALAALVAVMVATSVVKNRNGETGDVIEHTQLPVDSEHAVVRDTQLEEETVHPMSEFRELTRPMIDLSLTSVEEGHKAIHYADDIDAALFSHSKREYEQNVANKRSFI